MNYAKEIAHVLIPVSIAWALSYLLGAFISASWNIAEWTPQARMLGAVWSTVFGGALWIRLRGIVL